MDVRWWCLLAFLLSSVCGATARERNTQPYKLVCVRGNNQFDSQRKNPYFEEVDYSRCTHVVHNNLDYYSYINTENNNLPLLNESLKLVRNLRATNPNVTQLLSWNEWIRATINGNIGMTIPEKRAQMLRNLTNILTEFDLDGVDLTWHHLWHYHDLGNNRMMPKDNFTDAVQALREELDKHGFLLTATVNGRTDLAQQAYDVPKLSQYLDFINLMGYDLLAYNPNGNTAQHFAPVDSLPGADSSYSVNSALKYWLDQGADPHKLVLGVSALGRPFGLTNGEENGPFAPVEWWNAGYPFRETYNFYVSYPEMCLALRKNPKWTVVRNEIWQAPYAFNNDTWVSYDDEVSVTIKMDLVSAKDLGGAMIDFYNAEADLLGVCDRKYPLSSVVLEKLAGTATTTPSSETTTPASTTTRTTETTTPASAAFECRRGGFFEYPGVCTKYYECVPKGSGYRAIVHDCDEGLAFDARVENCVNKGRVRNC